MERLVIFGFLAIAFFAVTSVHGQACRDLYATCRGYRQRGYCKNWRYKQYMSINCKRSCNLCRSGYIGTSCADRNVNCRAWHSRGECRRNPAFMKINCCKSCKVVNGGYGSWTAWVTCSRTCDGGNQERKRYCNNPRPKNGGSRCSGKSRDSRKCNTKACRKVQVKPTTKCADNPKYMSMCKDWATAYCVKTSQYYDFMMDHCKETCGFCKKVVNGGYSQWTAWGGCSRKCGGGVKLRKRFCNNPVPKNGGAKCRGNPTESKACNTEDCETDVVTPGQCVDKYGDTCALWATAYCGEGNKWYDFMIDNCRKACDACDKKPLEDKCKTNNGGCEQICKAKDDQVECSCEDGFVINPDFKTCTKVPTKKDAKCGKAKEFIELGRIIGGEKVSFPFKWVWQGGMYYYEEFTCGGALIEPDLFLTAAHCVTGGRAEDGMVIRMGDYNRVKDEEPEQEIEVKKIVAHEGWSWVTLQNDIALLKLKDSFKLNDEVGLVCLPGNHTKPAGDSECYITGWGRTSADSDPALVLHEAKLPIVPQEECSKRNVNKFGESKIVDNMICGGFQDKDSVVSGCRGDSGGPYVCKKGDIWELQGVVSWGSNRCDVQHKYTVFTRISNYIDWIEKAKKEANDA